MPELDRLISASWHDMHPVTITWTFDHMADGDTGAYEHTYTIHVLIETETQTVVFKRQFTGSGPKLSNGELETQAKQWGEDTQKMFLELLGTSEMAIVK